LEPGVQRVANPVVLTALVRAVQQLHPERDGRQTALGLADFRIGQVQLAGVRPDRGRLEDELVNLAVLGAERGRSLCHVALLLPGFPASVVWVVSTTLLATGAASGQ